MIQGTENLLAFADRLPQRADNVECFFDHRAAAADLREAAEIITRLAPLECDIEAVVGED